MLPVNSFEGKLDDKTIKDFTEQLDHTLGGLEDRMNLVRRVLYTQGSSKEFIDMFFELFFDQERKPVPHFNVVLNKNNSLSENNFVCKNIEYIANYLLFSREALQQNDYSEHPYLDSNDRLTMKKREMSYEQLADTKDGEGNSRLEMELKNKKNFKKKPPFEIEKRDLEEIPEIRQIQDLIENIKYNLLPSCESNSQKRFYMRVMKDLRREQIDIKKIVRKPIEFKGIGSDETHFDFDSDTGYTLPNGDYKEVSKNKISLSDPNHIYNLLEMYSALRESSYSDSHSDIRYILDSLDAVIEKTPLRDFEKEIIILKIDGLTAEDILHCLKLKYGLEWDFRYLSHVWNVMIPKAISEQYEKDYEDWYFTFMEKGNYKTCSKCGEVKLTSYFGKDPRNKSGYKSICKVCDSKGRTK